MLLRAFPLLFVASVYVASAYAARATIDQVYQIMEAEPEDYDETPVVGGCTQEQIQMLSDDFPQWQNATWTTLQAMLYYKGGNYRYVPLALRYSLFNFMGISTSRIADTGEVNMPKNIVQASEAKRAKVLLVLRRMLSVITRGDSNPWLRDPTQLYCNSTALRYWPPDTPMPPGEGNGLLRDQPWYRGGKFYYYLPRAKIRQRFQKMGGFVAMDKIPDELGHLPAEPPYNTYAGQFEHRNPTFCLPQDRTHRTYAWTILGKEFVRFDRRNRKYLDVTILCPNYFNREAIDSIGRPTGPILRGTINTTRQCNPNEPLQDLQPRWLTLYAEMMYQILSSWPSDGSGVFNQVITRNGPSEPPFAPPTPKDKDKDFTIHYSENIQTADECLVVGDYDRAYPFSRLSDAYCVKSMQNYGWYVITLYLWYVSPGHPIWGTGSCALPPATEREPKILPEFPNSPQGWPLRRLAPVGYAHNSDDSVSLTTLTPLTTLTIPTTAIPVRTSAQYDLPNMTILGRVHPIDLESDLDRTTTAVITIQARGRPNDQRSDLDQQRDLSVESSLSEEQGNNLNEGKESSLCDTRPKRAKKISTIRGKS